MCGSGAVSSRHDGTVSSGSSSYNVGINQRQHPKFTVSNFAVKATMAALASQSRKQSIRNGCRSPVAAAADHRRQFSTVVVTNPEFGVIKELM